LDLRDNYVRVSYPIAKARGFSLETGSGFPLGIQSFREVWPAYKCGPADLREISSDLLTTLTRLRRLDFEYFTQSKFSDWNLLYSVCKVGDAETSRTVYSPGRVPFPI